MNWQPIETAPEGESVLIYLAPIDQVTTSHKDEDGVWYAEGGNRWPRASITHWMPLPEPPK